MTIQDKGILSHEQIVSVSEFKISEKQYSTTMETNMNHNKKILAKTKSDMSL